MFKRLLCWLLVVAFGTVCFHLPPWADLVISAVAFALKLWVKHLAFSLAKAFWKGFLKGWRDLKRASEREQAAEQLSLPFPTRTAQAL